MPRLTERAENHRFENTERGPERQGSPKTARVAENAKRRKKKPKVAGRMSVWEKRSGAILFFLELSFLHFFLNILRTYLTSFQCYESNIFFVAFFQFHTMQLPQDS
jgi:hypothetical protein